MSDNINILVKLFETLKESSDRNEEATQKLILQQLEMVNHIKHLPIDDLREALKEHAKDSKKEIDDCAGTVESTTFDIMELLRTINNKITKMVIVVIVAFSVVTGGYFLIRYAAEQGAPPAKWEERLEAIEQDQHEDMDIKLKEFMDEIIKEINKRHTEEEDESVHH